MKAHYNLGLACLVGKQRDCALQQYNVLKMSDSSLAESLFSEIFSGKIVNAGVDSKTAAARH
jgi:hypothetical protein